MQSRLLIINCASDYFFYIPMGTFGLCDYLNKKDIESKILNLALYPKEERADVLRHYLESFRPTHAGLVLHWQETVEGFLDVSEKIKSYDKQIRIICGGFTAGYFGANLLKKCQSLDFIVKGDPEKPMELLLSGVSPSKVPNLIYRAGSCVRSNKASYFVDRDTLSNISFSELSYLYDYGSYLDAINRKLGFPIFMGRGCIYNCSYCGGSSTAFHLHSERSRPVNRSIDAVISDLKRIRYFTTKIYLCYENDKRRTRALFEAIKKEESLKKVFHLNYGAWGLPDEEFLKPYKELFVSSGTMRPVFELSPEVFDDARRRRIKKGRVYYSIRQMKDNIRLINRYLGEGVNISVFFSRYHDSVKTYSDMKREIKGTYSFKHNLLFEGIVNTKVFYDHLSTDVASRYWEEYIKNPRDFGSLLTAVKKVKTKEKKGAPLSNLCVYTPETLTEREILICESMILILDNLERYSHEMFHILFKCLDAPLVDLVEDIIEEHYIDKSNDVSVRFDLTEFLKLLARKIADSGSLEKVPFIDDLTALSISKYQALRCAHVRESSAYPERPKLNSKLFSVHNYDYMDLPGFLKRLDSEGVSNLRLEETVSLFLVDEILSMPRDTFDATLKMFENNISVDEYLELMRKKAIFTTSYHRGLLDKLIRSGVLV